jgi:hypothetical protein
VSQLQEKCGRMEPTVDFISAVATDLFSLAKSLTEKWQMTGNKLEFNNKKKSVRKKKMKFAILLFLKESL